MSTLVERLQALKIIPVIAINNADDAVDLGRVLVENGMPSAEITFRTPAAAEAIRRLRAAFPGKKWIFRQKVYFCHGRYGSSQTVCFCDTYKKRKKKRRFGTERRFFCEENRYIL